MEVRDIFELRREGRTEEAYRAILQIYAIHQGPHTNLCMFWCTNDLFKMRVREKGSTRPANCFTSSHSSIPIFKTDCSWATEPLSTRH